ncbi:conserved hypothetical protein [Candidatus Methylobacter favarea]|uniref:Uncharacterized protein n=1 Tax=Candidatus Methylobacter favarea TaxID=2707345 RepID=A0A8S0XKG5_9GAMM|nr:hypothetical protein [Candidatus Methylobacter favarea]CAA9892042.1 conserved hypothetical protein [Candidatus Methylobacter favarea]
MQTFEQVKDVIDYNKKLHDRLRKYYLALNEKSQSDRVKLLLNYLIEDQRHTEETLASFEAVTQQSILDTWLQYAPSIDLHQLIDSHPIRAEMSMDEIVQLICEFGEAFVNFFQEAANESELPKISQIFQNLVAMETEAKNKQLRAASFEDM